MGTFRRTPKICPKMENPPKDSRKTAADARSRRLSGERETPWMPFVISNRPPENACKNSGETGRKDKALESRAKKPAWASPSCKTQKHTVCRAFFRQSAEQNIQERKRRGLVQKKCNPETGRRENLHIRLRPVRRIGRRSESVSEDTGKRKHQQKGNRGIGRPAFQKISVPAQRIIGHLGEIGKNPGIEKTDGLPHMCVRRQKQQIQQHGKGENRRRR